MSEQEDHSEPPGLTVGALRRLLEGVSPDMKITIQSNEFTGGIISASVTEGCDGFEHFALSCSDDADDFEDE